jgi:hypothetical protein
MRSGLLQSMYLLQLAEENAFEKDDMHRRLPQESTRTSMRTHKKDCAFLFALYY